MPTEENKTWDEYRNFVMKEMVDGDTPIYEHPTEFEFTFDNVKVDKPKATVKLTQINNDQAAKTDEGKPRLTLVPPQIIVDIARVREYGNCKYGDPENWKQVGIDRYRDAAYRHWIAYLKEPHGVDKESGLPHLWHVCCNLAFICEMEHDFFNFSRIRKNMENWK